MKEFNVNNCYKLYEDKFGESIQEPLVNTIRESQTEIESKLENFIQEKFQDPIPAALLDSNIDTKAKRVLNEIINSKNHLLNHLNSPFLHLYINYKEDVPELARRVTWYWLSFPKSGLPVKQDQKLKNLKETLISIGYHLSIYYWNDSFSSFIEENDPTVKWPKKDQLEIYQINSLDEELSRQKKLNTEFRSLDNKWLMKEKEANKKLSKELDEKKDELSRCRTDLQLLNGPYFYHEDSLFKDYVFGDILPELKSVYDLLKEYQVYNSNWGYFCYCLTWANSATKNSPHQKITLNIQQSGFTANDVGYILYLLKRKYMHESELPFLQWVMFNIVIISGHGKSFETEEEYIQFSERSMRSFKNGKSRPKFYTEINQKLHSLL